MNINALCTQLNEYLVESEDQYWQNWVGLKDDIDLPAITGKYPLVFDMASIDAIRTALQKTDHPEQKYRLRSILGQLTLSYMEYVGADIQQEILKKEAVTAVTWKNESIPVRSFQVKIMQEPDRMRRREMIALRQDAVDRSINPLRIRMMERIFSAIRVMGYNDYIALCSETQNRDFRTFAAEMESFLTTTEEPYRHALDHYLARITGTGLTDESHSADLTAVMKFPQFDPAFPPNRLLDVLHRTIGGMGFSLDRVHLDLEDRPSKKPRACVSAVNPPDDVRLTIYPIGGIEDYSGLLHEAGHAIHFIHEKPDLDFIYKFWGDRGFTEGTAYLFQNITLNPDWLRSMMNLASVDELIHYSAFMGILRFRRLIGQFLYQLDLFSTDNPSSIRERYQHHFERAHQVAFETCDYLTFDLEFYSAGYLRARMFELQMREYFERMYGSTWWRDPSCGDYLKTLFRNGRKNRADDVVIQFGYSGLDAEYYQKRHMLLMT
ncbi:hypothetical protein JXA80_02640 [bacterium]|nr:hypothetical protein [candidate division CSSED10-310 bacterium]